MPQTALKWISIRELWQQVKVYDVWSLTEWHALDSKVMVTGHSQLELLRGPAATVERFGPLLPRPIVGILTEDFLLGSLVIDPFIKRAAIVQESSHRTPLPGVAHGITEHFVDLFLGGHPPVGVGRTVHPNEFCGNTHTIKKERENKQLVFAEGGRRGCLNLNRSSVRKALWEIQCNAMMMSLIRPNLLHIHFLLTCKSQSHASESNICYWNERYTWSVRHGRHPAWCKLQSTFQNTCCYCLPFLER